MNIVDMTNNTSAHRFRPEDQGPPFVEQGTGLPAHCTCNSLIEIIGTLVICCDSGAIMGRANKGKT